MVSSRYEQLTAPFKTKADDTFQVLPWMMGGLLATTLVWLTFTGTLVKQSQFPQASPAPSLTQPQLPNNLEAALRQMGNMAGFVPTAVQIQKNKQILRLSLPLDQVFTKNYRNLTPSIQKFLKGLAVRLLAWPIQLEIEAQLSAMATQQLQPWEQSLLYAGQIAHFLTQEKVSEYRVKLRPVTVNASLPAGASPQLLIDFRAEIRGEAPESAWLSHPQITLSASPSTNPAPTLTPTIPTIRSATPVPAIPPAIQKPPSTVSGAKQSVSVRTIRPPIKSSLSAHSRMYPLRRRIDAPRKTPYNSHNARRRNP